MNNLLRENIRIALRALKNHKLRTALSLLGMAIGIMSIVIIMSAGQSLRLVLIKQLETFGTDTITVEVKIPNTQANSSDNAAGIAQGISITTLNEDDKDAIDEIPGVATTYAAVMGQGTISSPYDEQRINYFAVTHEFQDVDTGTISRGNFYTYEDEQSLAKYIVLGSTIAENLFPNQDPLGQHVKVQNTNFTVVGVFDKRGNAAFFDMDNMVFIPLKTAQSYLLGFDHVSFIMVQVNDADQSAVIAHDMKILLRERHDITDPDKDDFAVTTMEESQAIITTILSGMTLVLTIIAGVALIVGGVGIMNIMYVAVNERVFEIGLRKSFGARQRTIQGQFLIESIIVTFLGGCAGILGALMISYLITIGASLAGFSWPFAFSFQAVWLSLAFSSIVGISFGYFPAKAAARLNPIAALNRNAS